MYDVCMYTSVQHTSVKGMSESEITFLLSEITFLK